MILESQSLTNKVFVGRYQCFYFFIADNRYFCITQTVSILPHEAK